MLFLFWIVNSVANSVAQNAQPQIDVVLPPGGIDFEDIFGSKFSSSEALAAFIRFNDWNDEVAYPRVEFNDAELSILQRREAEQDPNNPNIQGDDNLDAIAHRREYRQLK